MVRTEQGMTILELRALREKITHAAALRGAHNVRVFGSVARNQSQPTSDVDFVVDLEPGRTALDVSELILDLEEILHRDVDVVVIRRSTSLAEEIEREAIPL
jgi:uncharacterized protein